MTKNTSRQSFSSRLCEVEEIKKMKIGDPLDRSTDHGPQNHKAHLDKLLEYCEVGAREGATLVYGGRQVDRPGTLLTLFRAGNVPGPPPVSLFGIYRQVFSWSPLSSLMWKTTCSLPKRSPLVR